MRISSGCRSTHGLGAAEHLELPLRVNGIINDNGANPPGSRHPGIVNILFADGSSRAIKQTIAVAVWWALGTRAGGELISAGEE
jgi:prepilin-type processing-associated H-X9-DG protein